MGYKQGVGSSRGYFLDVKGHDIANATLGHDIAHSIQAKYNLAESA